MLLLLLPEPGPMPGTQQALNKCWLLQDTSIDFPTPVATAALFFFSLTGKWHRSPDDFVMHFLASS